MSDAWRTIDRFLAARRIKIGPPTLGQTTGGAHKPNSLHYQGRARDYGQSNSDLPAILAALRHYATGRDWIIEELFGLTLYCDSGKIFAPTKALYANHQDHVHVALKAGAVMPVDDDDEEDQVPDNPDLPNIEGPLSFHPIATAAGEVVGYYIFSTSTGELHAHPHPDHPGKVPYLGRSEELTPD